jgi:pyruvate dehydrogenase E2 component (dihydrolipoamide acetyltransferase)
MSTEICLPRVSADDAAVTLVKWHVAVGSRIRSGDVIAEIESDKAVVELEAEVAGVVTEIRIPEGSNDVHADQVLAVVDSTGAESAQAEHSASRPSSSPNSAAAGARSLANNAAPSDKPPKNDPRAGALLQEQSAAREARPSTPGNGISALAARMARQVGIDLQNISGSGADGRILADDIRAALGPAPRALDTRPPQHPAVDADTDLHGGFEPAYDLRAPDTMRRAIAERLTTSKREAPHFYMSVDCRADALLDFKNAVAANGPRGVKLSLNDLIVKVTAATLKNVPALNAAWSDDGIRHFRSVDLAVAVAVEGGLVTPVIRGAENKSIAEIAEEMRALATRARAGQLAREEYQGASFTISNMGMYGISHFSAIINPPQAAILAVGAASERPISDNGAITSATMMTCTLSVDHRVADGVAGAEFLQAFKRLIEDPRLLLL